MADEPTTHVPYAERTGHGAHDPAAQFAPYFEFNHLPPRLQNVSAPFRQLYRSLMQLLPPGAEKTAGMRKLLEAKDCAVRAALLEAKDCAVRAALPPA